jgi:regulator of protease activity HflC (stomatin/prohibitin superfamily)
VDVSGRIVDETSTHSRVDLRESLFNFVRQARRTLLEARKYEFKCSPQDVYSRDTVLLEVACVMFYRIVDIRKACYEVDDLPQVGRIVLEDSRVVKPLCRQSPTLHNRS